MWLNAYHDRHQGNTAAAEAQLWLKFVGAGVQSIIISVWDLSTCDEMSV